LPMDDLSRDAQVYTGVDAPDSVCVCLTAVPGLRREVSAMRLLSGLGYGVLRPLLRDSMATGSLMRRKLEPLTSPLLERIGVLQGQIGDAPGS